MIRTAHKLPRAACLFALTLAVLCGPGESAKAQLLSLQPETAQSVTLSPAQRTEIDEFIRELSPRVFGENRADASRAFDNLITPLRDDRISVAFRQTMAEALIDDIETALADERILLDNGKINARPYHALRLAGELATDRTLRAIVTQLDSKDIGRRFFAIHCTEMVFFAVRTTAPAVTERTIFRNRPGGEPEGLIADLGDMLVKEQSSRHAGALIRSLGEAGRISDNQMRGVASSAVRLIGEKTSQRVRMGRNDEQDTEERKVWLTAGRAVQTVIAQSAGDVDAATSRAAIRLAGHMVASVYRDIESGRIGPVAERQGDDVAVMEKQMLALAQNLMLFGEQRHAEATGRRREQGFERAAGGLVDAFLGRDDQNFRQSALKLISTNGLLTVSPYGFSDDEFIGE